MSQKVEAIWSQFDVSYGIALDLLPAALAAHTLRKVYSPEEVIVSEGDSLQ